MTELADPYGGSAAGPPALAAPQPAGRSRTLAVNATEFDRFYDEHVSFVWRCVRRLGVPDDAAEDVAQSVFLVVYRRLGDFAAKSSVRTWVFAIVMNVVRDYRRARRRRNHWLPAGESSDLAKLPDETARTPHEALERSEAARLIDQLLAELDEDKRVVFLLAELEQMTAQEISAATGLSVKKIHSRLRAARTDFERAAARLRRQQEWRTR
jgi:RNA polymerase sigma-70 factor (ECF subfamily)